MTANSLGLNGCPVSKSIVLTSVASTLYAHNSKTSEPALRSLAFIVVGDLALGSLLLYHARVFERQQGSSRYGAFVLAVLVGDQLISSLLRSLTPFKFVPGPSSLIAALSVLFCTEIPATQDFNFFGICLSNKVFWYAANAYLLASAARNSAPGLAVGALLGLAHHCNVFNFKSLKVPAVVTRALSRTVGRLLGSQGQQHARTFPTAGTRPQVRPQSWREVQVSEDSLSQLISMGFEESQARAALQQSGNDFHSALSRLL